MSQNNPSLLGEYNLKLLLYEFKLHRRHVGHFFFHALASAFPTVQLLARGTPGLAWSSHY
jgi:hypothetical protein